MIGKNLIGKIYKNKKIISLSDGYMLTTKIKSNFGGVDELKLIFILNKEGYINLYTNKNLLINLSDDIKKNTKCETNKILINDVNFNKVNQIIKPDLYNIEKTVGKGVLNKKITNGIYIPLVVENNKIYDIIDIYLVPSIYNGAEYIEMKIENIENEKLIIKTVKEDID